MKASAIGWTDYSGGDLNFVTGCTPVSEGCQHCYARAIARRFGRDFDTVVCDEEKLLRAARRDYGCLLYTSDAADDLLRVDPGGRRIIKKKNITYTLNYHHNI